MPSIVDMEAPQPNASLNIARNAQVIRSARALPDVLVPLAESLDQIQAAVQKLQQSSRLSPRLRRLSVESADIANLIVGAEDGPGQLQVFSGPPSYTEVGFIGTSENGTSVAITSVSGDTVTTAAPHLLDPGDIVLILGNTSLNHLNYWIVATTPTPTTYTLANPPSGSGSGGTSTKQFGGGWLRQFAFGESSAGAGRETAPVYTTPLGQVRIGTHGSVSLRDSLEIEKGYLGVVTEADKSVSAAANNGSGLIRLTVTAHGYETGDDVVVDLPGILSAPGDYAVTVITANTFDLIGSTFAGAYSGGGTAARYRGPFWGQSIAGGGTGYDDAPFRTFRDGSLRIGDPSGARIVVNADGSIDVVDAAINIEGATFDITISPTDGVIVESATSTVQLHDGYVQVFDNAGTNINGIFSNQTMSIRYGSAGPEVSGSVDASHARLIVAEIAGGVIDIDSNFGIDNSLAYKVNGVDAITASRDGSFVDLSYSGTLTGPSGSGASGSISYVSAITPNTTLLNYQDHGGFNQSLFVVTGVTPTFSFLNYSGGLVV
jgi:hypothetical protein